MEMRVDSNDGGERCRAVEYTRRGRTQGHAAERMHGWRKADAELRRIAKQRAGLDAEEAHWLLQAREERVHERLGYGTFLEYLERVLGYSPKVATERLRVADALSRLPRVRAALSAGDASFSAVRELTRVATAETEEPWLAAVLGKTVREIERMVAGRTPGDLPDSPPDPSLIEHRLVFEVTAETHALLRDALRKLRDDAGGHLSDDQALRQMARVVLGGPTDEGRASYQIALTVCARCDKAQVHGGGELVDVEPEVLERARCDAQELGPVNAQAPARATQDIPPAIRRLVMFRDHGRCVVPGCRSSRYLDVHHLRFRSAGGGHVPSNLAAFCSGHHDQIHAGRLIVTGTAPALAFWHADGSPYGSVARPAGLDGPANGGGPGQEYPVTRDGVFADAVSALRNLGFKAVHAKQAVLEVRPHVGANPAFDSVMRAALRHLSPRTSS